jgi:hypothetical protein
LGDLAGAYERLLLDAMLGDSTLVRSVKWNIPGVHHAAAGEMGGRAAAEVPPTGRHLGARRRRMAEGRIWRKLWFTENRAQRKMEMEDEIILLTPETEPFPARASCS